MSELALLILRYGFLLLLWVFIFAIVYALRSDLFGAPARKLRGGSTPHLTAAQNAATSDAAATPQPVTISPELPLATSTELARTLQITSGVAGGTTIALDEDVCTIGRSPDSTLVIMDEFTSTYHAKLSRSGKEWLLTDLDSTNGTKLAGAKIHQPTVVPLFTPVTIGQTTFELRP